MASIMTVAREARVAVSTVSLALNHRDRVKPETRQRIDEVIERLGYRPRAKRRRDMVEVTAQMPMRAAFLYTQDAFRKPGDNGLGTRNNGMTLPDDTGISGYCRDIISGMQESIAGSSCSLSVFRGADHVDHDGMIAELIEAREFDGVVVFGADPRNGYLDRFERSGMPMVAINHPSSYGRFSCVTTDYFGGGLHAIDHLYALGHRRIAIGQNQDGKWLTDQLAAGVRHVMAKYGIEPVMLFDSMTSEPLEVVGRRMLDAGATVCFTGDAVAVRLANAMESMGVRVPEDFSILGFDDRGMMTARGQRLTSIGYDKRRMGRMAIRMLQQLHQSKNKVRWHASAVTTFVSVGQTTGKAPSQAVG